MMFAIFFMFSVFKICVDYGGVVFVVECCFLLVAGCCCLGYHVV